MSKDPAFLFYPNDFMGGTMGMTFEEKGAYIELLILQFNRGHMSGHMIGQTVGQLWDNIKDKFQVDEEGKYFNERLDIEKSKRQNFTKSRRNNLLGINQHTKNKNKKSGHTTSYMENENENVNEIEVIDEIVIKNESVYITIEYEIIKNKFNEICNLLEPVLKMTNSRIVSISKIIKEYKPDDVYGFFELVFTKVSQSSFLNGGGNNGWKMTFDWMLKQDNFLKIIENHYQDEKPNNKKTGKQYSDDFKRKIAQGLQS